MCEICQEIIISCKKQGKHFLCVLSQLDLKEHLKLPENNESKIRECERMKR